MLGDRRRLKVATIGAGVPEEVLVAAGADVVPVTGTPGEPTELADRYIEPMVGERARSQLQRVLDGTYERVELLRVLARGRRSAAALLRAARAPAARARAAAPAAPSARHPAPRDDATRRWNEARVRELCALLGVDEAVARARRSAACNAARPASDPAERRAAASTSPAARTRTPRSPADRGRRRVVVEGRRVPRTRTATRRRGRATLEHPLLARARASSAERARSDRRGRAAAAAPTSSSPSISSGDDGVRWEFPELRAALEAAGIPTVAARPSAVRPCAGSCSMSEPREARARSGASASRTSARGSPSCASRSPAGAPLAVVERRRAARALPRVRHARTSSTSGGRRSSPRSRSPARYLGVLRDRGYPDWSDQYGSLALASSLADDDDPPWGGLPRPTFLVAHLDRRRAAQDLRALGARERRDVLRALARPSRTTIPPTLARDDPARLGGPIGSDRLDLMVEELRGSSR